MCVIIQFSQ